MAKASQASCTSSAGPAARRDVRIGLGTVLLVLLAVPFAVTLLLVEGRWAPPLRADQRGRDAVHQYAVSHAGFVVARQVISALGSGFAWVVVLTAVVAWLAWRRLPRLAVFVVAAALGSALLNVVAKTTVHRLRPVLSDPVAHAQGLSFPSAHAQAAVVGYALLVVVFLPILQGVWLKGALTLAVVAVLAIGLSRLALGVHYVSDVLGGFLLGAAWVTAMAAAFNVAAINWQRREALRSGRSSGGQVLGSTPGG